MEQLLPDIIDRLGDATNLDYYVCLPELLLQGVESFLLECGIPAAQLQLEPLRQQPSACQ
jgi:hypothetical protein